MFNDNQSDKQFQIELLEELTIGLKYLLEELNIKLTYSNQ